MILIISKKHAAASTARAHMEPSPIRSPSKEGQPPRMVCVIFVAGHNDLLESEIASDVSGRFDKLKGVPKALLPAAASADGSGSTILGRWWNLVNTRQILEVFLVTNANKFKYYERWATANDFPVENIINDGTTSAASRMGSVADLDLVLRSKPSIAESDVMVVAGDMIFSNDFDISGVQRFFREKQGDVAVYYELPPQEQSSSRGIIEVDPRTSLVTSFYEKPAEGVTTSRFASVVFYMFRRTSLPLLATYLAAHPAIEQRVFGSFLAWLVAPPADRRRARPSCILPASDGTAAREVGSTAWGGVARAQRAWVQGSAQAHREGKAPSKRQSCTAKIQLQPPERHTPIQTSTNAHARTGTAQASVPSREALVHGVVAAGWRLRHLRTHGVGVNARAHGEA